MWFWIISVPFFIILLLIYRNFYLGQFMILTAATLLYLVFAIVYHLQDKTLRLEVVIEYVLLAILALIVFQDLLL